MKRPHPAHPSLILAQAISLWRRRGVEGLIPLAGPPTSHLNLGLIGSWRTIWFFRKSRGKMERGFDISLRFYVNFELAAIHLGFRTLFASLNSTLSSGSMGCIRAWLYATSMQWRGLLISLFSFVLTRKSRSVSSSITTHSCHQAEHPATRFGRSIKEAWEYLCLRNLGSS